MYSMRRIYLIGIGTGSTGGMTQEAAETLRKCSCVIGAGRMLAAAQKVIGDAQKKPDMYDCYKPELMHRWLLEHPEYESAAIVLSGDVGFYSGAKKIRDVLKDCEIYTIPGISSVVYLAAHLGTAWEDAVLMSAHGREQNFIQTIAYSPKVFLLLGGKNCGADVWRRLQEYPFLNLLFYIGKNLSYENEEIFERTQDSLKPDDLEGLCTVLVRNLSCGKYANASVSDEEWIRGKVPMTKEEVRTVSISKLGLEKNSVLYDIGAGTGSVAIEAALKSEQIRVYAVEKNPEGIELIRQNKRKFYTDWVCPIEGSAPDAWKD